MKNETCTDIQVLHVSEGTAWKHSSRVGTSRHCNLYICMFVLTLCQTKITTLNILR